MSSNAPGRPYLEDDGQAQGREEAPTAQESDAAADGAAPDTAGAHRAAAQPTSRRRRLAAHLGARPLVALALAVLLAGGAGFGTGYAVAGQTQEEAPALQDLTGTEGGGPWGGRMPGGEPPAGFQGRGGGLDQLTPPTDPGTSTEEESTESGTTDPGTSDISGVV